MRVLHVTSGNLYGGIEVMLVTLARFASLAPTLDQHFAVAFPGRLRDQLDALGAPVHRLPSARASRPLTVLGARRALRVLAAAVKPDAIICHATWAHAIFAAAVRRAKRPLVHFQHGAVTGRHWLDWWAARTPPDLALVNSRFTGTTLANIFPGVPAEVVRCPVPAPPPAARSRAELRASLGTPPEATVIVQVGRLDPIKGHTVLLAALARLDRSLAWECWVVGGAQREEEVQYLASLQRHAERAGLLPRVRFLGERSDARELLPAADLYCQANVGPEGFGLTFVEALWAGLPVVTSGIGAATEIVDESCGALVPPGDELALSEVVGRLIGSESERSRLGAAGPARARALCDPAQQLARLEASLAVAAGGGGSRG